MQLTVPHTKIPDPSDTQIVAVLEDLSEDGNRFAILGIDDQTYIQTAITPQGFVVEYREGSGASHYASTSQSHDLETVKRLFLLYHAQDPRYKSLIEYRQWQRPSPSLFDIRIRDLTVWGWLVSILYLAAVLGVFLPVAYRVGTVPALKGNELVIATLLVPLFFAVTVITFLIARALAKRLGISLFREKKEDSAG